MHEFTAHQKFSLAIHNRILELLRLYFFTGGIPEAVAYYTNEKDLSGIEKIHSGLIQSIQFDFAKYGTRKPVGLGKWKLNSTLLNDVFI